MNLAPIILQRPKSCAKPPFRFFRASVSGAVFVVATLSSIFGSIASAVEPERNDRPVPAFFRSGVADPTLAQFETRPEHANKPFVGLPHIQQPPYSMYCGPTVVAMAFQRHAHLRLTCEDAVTIANVVSTDVAKGVKGARASHILPLLGMEVNTKGFNPEKLTDVGSVSQIAKKQMTEYVIPALKSGSCVLLMINSTSNTAHMILLADYDESKKEFLVNNPSQTSSCLMKEEELVKRWPCRYGNGSGQPFQLQAYVVQQPEDISAQYANPEPSKQIKLDPKFRSLVGVHAETIVSTLDELTPELTWNDAARFWEKGRNPQEAKGLPLLLKLQIAKGCPVFLAKRLSEGGKGLNIIVAHGYKGEYNDANGLVTVSGDFQGDGFISERDISTPQLINFSAIVTPGKTYLPLGFVKPVRSRK